MGRKKGTPNKTTALLKNAILKAAENAGNRVGSEGLVSYLEDQAEKNPVAFMGLLGKVLPLQLSGDAENPVMAITRIVLVPGKSTDVDT